MGLQPVLRVLADRPERPASFLILGSASPELVGRTSETLAGRVEFVDLHGLRQLQPWFENLGKRQVRSPKLYLRDSGLLHHLLGVGTRPELMGHPKAGASWEGWAKEQVLRARRDGSALFWATQSGAELDLLVFESGKRVGYEFKFQESPRITRSMRVAMEDLSLDVLRIVAPVSGRIPLDEKIEAAGVDELVKDPDWIDS